MRNSRLLAVAGILVMAGCGEIQDLMKVASAIQGQYHMPATVNLSNDSHLLITFQNAPVASMKLDSAGMDGFARGVAAFAKAHYPKAEKLDDVTVGFATVSTIGPLTTTRTDAPYRYRASELP